jgi:hypothetical protein
VNLPQTGKNEQKAKFFADVGKAFQFLEIYYTLSAEDQLKLMQLMTKLQTEGRK